MVEARDIIAKLRDEAESWRAFHKARRADVEALAASIRIKAFNDALRALAEAKP